MLLSYSRKKICCIHHVSRNDYLDIIKCNSMQNHNWQITFFIYFYILDILIECSLGQWMRHCFSLNKGPLYTQQHQSYLSKLKCTFHKIWYIMQHSNLLCFVLVLVVLFLFCFGFCCCCCFLQKKNGRKVHLLTYQTRINIWIR